MKNSCAATAVSGLLMCLKSIDGAWGRDYDRAIADWEAVLRIAPNNVDTKNNIGVARRQRGY